MGNPMSRPLYIFDLDGTLADIQHRRHFVERPRGQQDWVSFHCYCVNDSPVEAVIRTMESLRRFADVWIFSGRSDEVREQTVQWLMQHTSFMSWELESGLVMRQEGDYTPDDQLKLKWLNEMLDEDRERLVAVFEDRDRMVKMWRANGVPCFQVAPGDF